VVSIFMVFGIWAFRGNSRKVDIARRRVGRPTSLLRPAGHFEPLVVIKAQKLLSRISNVCGMIPGVHRRPSL
jgi:hypothetical protein